MFVEGYVLRVMSEIYFLSRKETKSDHERLFLVESCQILMAGSAAEFDKRS